ncbi:hypothetical protein KW791_00980 [Candidatus Parcubacteria bacterium]|nr:hypothetical protein [Candidatus Parcubacteria bacterium]
MPTVINNPPTRDDGNAAGAIVTGVVIIVLVVLFLVYGLPRIRGTGGSQVNIPDTINVNTSGNPSQ